MAVAKTKVSHDLKMKFVKGTGRWEGACSCGRFDVSGAKTSDIVQGQFDLHQSRQN